MSTKPSLQTHVRQTFLAGIFAALPVAVTIFIVTKVDQLTRFLTEKVFHRDIPLVGILIALLLIYFCGMIATTLFGKFFLRIVDALLSRLPVLRSLYTAWKQVALTPGGTEGIYSRTVLIPDETGATHLIGFCCGKPIDGDANTYAVFVPGCPNPINGRLYFVRTGKFEFVDLSTEEAFKVVLSTGNYIPAEIGTAAKRLGAYTRPTPGV